MSDLTLQLISTGEELCKKYGITLKEAPLAEWPDKDIKYLIAEEVKEIGKQVIEKWRTDLRNVNIAYVFKQKASKSNDNITLGMAKSQGDLAQALTGNIVAVVEIGFDTWLELDQDQKARLVFHELCHIAYDMSKGKIGIVPHQIEEFVDVIKLFGPGNGLQAEYISAYNKFRADNVTITKD